ncbi:MAG TPA: type VI secretion system baseplate subunit TssK [Bryobacteraceae bacterium]|jgi:type VI secretion system protein ImpJ|nr:type VI secretion system baseplate subunit TssK [Bryobacteraceae bacterium]
MKNLSRVVWSEGMYIGPHHFQAQNRYFEDSVHTATESLYFAPFGFTGYELDSEALRNGTLNVVHARGLFADGLSFHMPGFDELPAPRSIAGLFPPMQDSLDFFLAVPEHRQGACNCALDENESMLPVRYIAEEVPLPDENTGRDVKLIRLGRKNIRLLAAGEDSEGLMTLPLGRVRRHGSGQFVLDEKFVPPVLQISSAAPLMAMLRRLLGLLDEKCKTIAKPKDLGSATVSGFSAEGIANAWFLHCINSSVAPLRHLCISKRAHPEELFVEMSRLAGALCTFSLDSHPAALPLYDHLNLAECFDALDRHIRTHLELIVPSNTVAIPLASSAPYFWDGKIADERTLNRSRWIFGIRSKIGEADLIERTPRLVKICSRLFVPKLVERALPGLKLSHIPAPPPALSPKIEYQYFAIDKSGPCWEHMVKTREVGVYIPGELPDPELELSVILES